MMGYKPLKLFTFFLGHPVYVFKVITFFEYHVESLKFFDTSAIPGKFFFQKDLRGPNFISKTWSVYALYKRNF